MTKHKPHFIYLQYYRKNLHLANASDDFYRKAEIIEQEGIMGFKLLGMGMGRVSDR
jgi:hypothetical protein